MGDYEKAKLQTLRDQEQEGIRNPPQLQLLKELHGPNPKEVLVRSPRIRMHMKFLVKRIFL